jgi:DNA-binding transcriptional MerR regulator
MEVCRKTGITYRQLDYWTRIGRIKAAKIMQGGKTVERVHSGTQRYYSYETIQEIRNILQRVDECPTCHRRFA